MASLAYRFGFGRARLPSKQDIESRCGGPQELMTIGIRILRSLFLVALAIYTGGFTFYMRGCDPSPPPTISKRFSGWITTQRVTDQLNVPGVATLLLGWCIALGATAGDRDRADRGRRWQLGMLATSSICLVALLVLHRVMDRKLANLALAEFYPWHRAYLSTSTVQWIANLGLLIQSASATTPSRESPR